MKQDASTNSVEVTFPRAGQISRRVIAGAIVLVIAAYLGGIVSGRIPDGQKLGAADLGLLVVGGSVAAILLRPEFLDRLTHVKFGNVEVELQKLQRDQQNQRNELDDLRFVLTLLLQGNELKYMRSLQGDERQAFVGGHGLRTELRRLRTLGLIRNLGATRIGDITDNHKFDLAKFVELTERGKHYLERVGEGHDD
jgi:hypothetical protein